MRTFAPARPCRGVAPKLLALAFVLLLPAACVEPTPPPPPPAPPNPFAGDWSTPERTRIAFRDDTVVINPPEMPATVLGKEACPGWFNFGYVRKRRDELTALAAQQPDIQRRLETMLVQPEYPVALLFCDRGESTYVLLDDHDLVAIYRDRGIVGVEQLTRL